MHSEAVQRSTDAGEKSATRALFLLELLAGMEQPSTLAQIMARAGLSKSSAYRALRSLQDTGFVDHLGRRGYRLGTRSFALASLVIPRDAFIRACRPILAWLVQFSNETAVVAMRSGDHRVVVFDMHPPREPRERSPLIGERTPLTSGCAGTAILAHLPEVEVKQIVARRPTRGKDTNPDQLATIRNLGYAISLGANHVGLNGIAAPLLSPFSGDPLGSLSISGSAERLDEVRLHGLSDALKRATTELAPLLAKRLGPMASERWPSLDASRSLADEDRGSVAVRAGRQMPSPALDWKRVCQS